MGYEIDLMPTRAPYGCPWNRGHMGKDCPKSTIDANLPASMSLAGDELRRAADEASDFSEFSLFYCAEGVCGFAGCIKLRMSAPKGLVWVSRGQMKTLVEFVPDGAAWGMQPFHHRKSNAAVLNRRFLGGVELEQGFIQIATGEQQTKPLLGNTHAVDLQFRPSCFGGSTKDAIRIEHDQCGLMIPVADSGGDNLLSSIAIQVGQGEVFQVAGMPVLREQFAVGVEDGELIGPPRVMETGDDDARSFLLLRS